MDAQLTTQEPRVRKKRTVRYEATSAPPPAKPGQIKGSWDVWNATTDFASKLQEHFAVFDLDARHRVIERRIVSVGTLNGVEVHPREVFKGAILNSAAAVILVHNHPSGDTAPSRQDVELTKRLCAGADLFGIPVLDHVVVAADGFTSMREKGDIQ